jgi:Holliday junction resolvase-like predicted endonuclease
MTAQEQADYAACTYAPNDMGIYETTGRLARGLAGEKAATEFLASEGHQILQYKPDITGTNQGGFDMVTMHGDWVYLVDNKAYRREGNLYSASALTTNFNQNLKSTIVELQAIVHDVGRSEEERDTAQRALDLIDGRNYQRLVTNASLSNIDNPGLSGVSDQMSHEVEFQDLMRRPKKEAGS